MPVLYNAVIHIDNGASNEIGVHSSIKKKTMRIIMISMIAFVITQ